MPDNFDHYYKWLGIPPADQPPNHYRLLGLPDFTDDPEVIANAADQRFSHLRTFQLGPRSALSQEVLNEVARARVCLLIPDKKAAYDAELRGPLTDREEPQSASPTDNSAMPSTDVKTSEQVQPVVSVIAGVAANHPANAKKHHSRERKPKKKSNPLLEMAKMVGGGVAGLAIGYVLVCWISPNNDFLGLRKSKQSKQVVTSNKAISLDPSIEAPPASNDPPTPPAGQNAVPQADSTQTAAVAEQPSNDPLPVEASPSPDSPPVVENTNEPPAPIESDEERLKRLTAERDAALAKGNMEAALKAVEAIAEMTDGDALDRKLAYVSRLLDAAETSSDTRRATEHLLRLLHQAVDANRKDLADRHTDQMIAGARRSSDADLVRWATLCVLKIQKM